MKISEDFIRKEMLCEEFATLMRYPLAEKETEESRASDLVESPHKAVLHVLVWFYFKETLLKISRNSQYIDICNMLSQKHNYYSKMFILY